MLTGSPMFSIKGLPLSFFAILFPMHYTDFLVLLFLWFPYFFRMLIMSDNMKKIARLQATMNQVQIYTSIHPELGKENNQWL